MQTTSYWIWTRVVVSISHDGNHLFEFTLTDMTTSSQSGPGSNGNKGVLYTPQIFIGGGSLLDRV